MKKIVLIFLLVIVFSISSVYASDFLLELANDTYNYFQLVDSNENGLLDGWYDPLIKPDGLIFSIGRYDGLWGEFDEYSPVNYSYNVDTGFSNKFPLILNDNPAGKTVYIYFNLNSTQREKELSLFLNAMLNWGGAIGKVQLYINNNFIEQFSLGGSYSEKSFNFSSNYFLLGKNTIKIEMSCLYCNAWFAWDSIQLGEKNKIAEWHKLGVGESFDDKASPEEIGFYMLSHLGAYEMGLIDKSTAKSEIINDLTMLENKPTSNGLFYRYYKTHKNEIVDYSLPSIGNAMLAASLMTIRQWAIDENFTTIVDKSSSIIAGINLTYFWDPIKKQFYHDSSKLGRWDYYSDEGRLLSFTARALGQISKQDFSDNLNNLTKLNLYYDVSTGESVLNKTDEEDILVNKTSWDSSMFTYLVPSLFIKEYETNYQEATINPAVMAQIVYANKSDYQISGKIVWGISDSFNTNLQYCWEYVGSPPTAAKYLFNHPYESCPGLITPHASALALLSNYSNEAENNLETLSSFKDIYTEFGFKDSFNVLNGNVTQRILTLDQEWIFLSLMNYFNHTIWKYFYEDLGVRRAHYEMYGVLPEFQKGFSYTSYWYNNYETSTSNMSLEWLKETGTEWVSILVTWYENKTGAAYSPIIYKKSLKTPSDKGVINAINKAHELGMKVMLKPHIDVSDESWRGYIYFTNESDWQAWFANYTSFILYYANLSEVYGVEQFSIGTELESTVFRENDWRNVIQKIRNIYSGPLTYSANHDRYDDVTWWDAIDYIGISAYFPLTTKYDPTIDELKTAWIPYKNAIEAVHNTWQKPILFTEIGYQSINGTNRQPNWVSGTIDLQEQADSYEAAFQTFFNESWFYGMYWWMWYFNPQQDVNRFDVYGKPAENIVKKWYRGRVPGDVDGNCKVDIFDLAKVGLCYGCLQGQACWNSCSVADLNADNAVNIFDLATVGLNYGKSC